MISKNGVYYDLEISPYKVEYNNVVFVFSSKLHLDKFKKKVKENRDIINYSLSKRFNYEIDVQEIADIVLYRKIETRGFLLYARGCKIECQKSIKCVGVQVTQRNLNES